MTPLGFFAGALIGAVLSPALQEEIQRAGALGVNYRGERIPKALGLVFPLTALFGICLFLTLGEDPVRLYRFGIAVFIPALAGLLDDFIGDDGPKGLKGHIGQLARGRFTSGAGKAVAGALTGYALSLPASQGTGEVFLNTLGFALFVNSVNLLDLRPGRALKGFFVSYGALLPWAGTASVPLAAPIVGCALTYAPGDLRGEIMMGDVGSASLGALLGLSYIDAPAPGKGWVLLVLLALHALAERYSFSTIIERIPVLQWADRLGQR